MRSYGSSPPAKCRTDTINYSFNPITEINSAQAFKIGTLKLIKIPIFKSASVGWVKQSAPNKTIMMGSLRLTHPTQLL